MPCDKRRAAALISFFLIASFVQSSENQALVYKKKYIMGTVFEIAAYDQSSEHASNAIERAFQEIVRLDDLMSNYKPDSTLSNLNRSAEVLHSMGIRDALINAGGSTIFAMGAPPDHTAWLVHLRDPSNKIDPQVMLKDGSVSTSEQTAPSLLGNDSAGHIIDPDTGM